MIDSQKPSIYVITGIQASGKSTVGRALAERFAKSVFIDADDLQGLIVNGARWPEAPGSEPRGEAADQLRLRLRNMCLLGKSFYDAGFTVVMSDIIMGTRWDELESDMQGYPYELIVLAPELKTVLQRDKERSKDTLGEAWAVYLNEELHKTMTNKGIWITNETSLNATVDRILLSQ